MFGQKPYNPEFSVQGRELAQHRQLKEAIAKDTNAAIKKFKPFSIVQSVLGAVTILFGIAIMVVAFSNRGFPVFNVGPLLTGILELVTGVCLFFTTKMDTSDKQRTKFNMMMKLHFVLSMVVVLAGFVSLVISFIAWSVCLNIEEEYFYYRGSEGIRQVHDVEQYCTPNKDLKIALSFFNGASCLLVVLWNAYGFCFYCSYCMLFGMGWAV